MYDLIMFDLDGTLVNSEEGVTKTVQYALSACGIEENNQNNLRRFIGPPLVDAFMEYYGMSEDMALKALEKYRERYRKTGVYENEIFPDVKNVLEELKKNGKKVALATSKPHIFAREVLKSFDLTQYFDIIVGAEFDGTRNDKADVIKEVLNQAGEYENPVMIGDRKHDAEGARKNGVDFIGVSFGFAPEREFEKCGVDKVIDRMSELLDIILYNNGD